MKVPSRSQRRWVRLPLLAAFLPLPGAGGYAAHQLRTIQPAMYDRTGVVDSGHCSEDDDVETIVFTSLRPGHLDVYLFDRDGTRPRRLTNHGNLDYNPVMSPDGRWVVFTSDRDGSSNLYALDLTTDGEPIALTSHPAMDDAPALSPDGSRLAFVSTRGGNPDIYSDAVPARRS